MIDNFVGIPQLERLQHFFNTAVYVHALATDEKVMTQFVDKIQEFLEKDDFDTCEKMLLEAYSYENWRPKFGPQLLVGIAYCLAVKEKEI